MGSVRNRARQHRRSIAPEVVFLAEENIPTAQEPEARKEFFRQVKHFQSRRPLSTGPFPSSEEMQREDRIR